MKLKRFQGQSLIPILSLILVTVFIGCDSFSSEGSEVKQSEPVYTDETIYPYTVYFPFLFKDGTTTGVELRETGTQNEEGEEQQYFYLLDTIQYSASGVNHLIEPASVDLSWVLEGPCGTTEGFSETLSLPAGTWQHTYNDVTPGCNGVYTGTVQVDHNGYISSLTTIFQVDLRQAFDRCILPTVDQMQAWWDNSPYSVWNIYLGGSSFYCTLDDLTPEWVQAVSQQGWKFILTWVGPQAPCSYFYNKFDSDWLEAYGDGIDEAAAALEAAESLGITGEKIIYYDLEAFSGADSACRLAARKFIEGWSTWLHLQGEKAGGYGSPCNSYLPDWYLISEENRPDDVWIAHWLLPAIYRSDASVWDTACMGNTYWPTHQRIRQYAGDHTETWGGVSLGIDSSVVDGDIVTYGSSPTSSLPPSDQVITGFQIQDIDLITSDVGWVLLDDQLLLASGTGDRWREITPDLGDGVILDVDFVEPVSGWLAALQAGDGTGTQITLFHTSDSGTTWDARPLPAAPGDFTTAYLDFIDTQTGWILLKMSTGSSFSVGRLFATQDGGATWDERPAPMGEPIQFLDIQTGWMVGGPGGDQIFQTRDGGVSWQSQVLPDIPGGTNYIAMPMFETSYKGVLPVTSLSGGLSRLMIYSTDTGGDTWDFIQEMELPSDFESGQTLPFSNFQSRWWSAMPASANLMTAPTTGSGPTTLTSVGLIPGITALDFVSEDTGWALVQEGGCSGEKIPGGLPGASPFVCSLDTRLFVTKDGGYQWLEITP